MSTSTNPYAGYSKRVAEALAYYDLCQRAEQLGIPTALDDPRSPKTVAGLHWAVTQAEREGRAA